MGKNEFIMQLHAELATIAALCDTLDRLPEKSPHDTAFRLYLSGMAGGLQYAIKKLEEMSS